MKRLDSILEDILFGLVALVALAAPWLFGAWEMWWFWPFATAIFLATACFAARLTLAGRLGTASLSFSRTTNLAILAYVPFLAYALIRAIQTSVRMDAERSFLLHLTPVLLGAITMLAISQRRRRLLIAGIAVNILLIGLYGIANHYVARNAHVLWVEGYPQYQLGYARATGSYFCPDHFAGLMELGLAIGLAVLLDRAAARRLRLAAAPLIGVALWAIVLSKSRGAGLVTAALLVLALWWGSASWPSRLRWRVLGAGLAAFLLAALLVASIGGHYVKRFREYPWTNIERSDRYQMSAAALRGWASAPVWGIGPGMHPNLWPHLAPSPDGDRERGIWPRFLNNTFNSNAVHNDWFQLLEEYGAVGVALFVLAAGTGMGLLARGWRRCCISQATVTDTTAPARSTPSADWIILGALLAATAMAGHSIGDFNLQIPATTWLLALMAGAGLAETAERFQRRSSRHTRPFMQSTLPAP